MLTVMYLRKTPLKRNKRTNPSKDWKSASHCPLSHMIKDMLTKYNVGYADRNIGGTTLQTGPKHFLNKLTNEFEQLIVKWKVILNWMGIGQQCAQFPESGCSQTVVWYFRQLFVWLKWTQHEHSFPSETRLTFCLSEGLWFVILLEYSYYKSSRILRVLN